jgi:glycosyltransferase involved in cell wall biosynthesis
MKKKLKIAFINSKRFSFYPLDYLGRGLGGTESMLVLLTRALASKGHRVEVFNCCYKPGVYDEVSWRPVWEFDNSEEYDVCISLRLLETFEEFDIKSPLRAVWIHDDSLSGAKEKDETGKVNMWIGVSETQKKFIEKTEKIKDDHWFVTRNAYDENLYKKKAKVKNQLIYCSAPDRGLKHLLSYWDEIKKIIPDATLHVTGSFALWGNADEENERFFSDLYGLDLKLKDVTFHKRLGKQELAELQASSELMVYPTTFDEMYCISAIECMSVGTPVISTSRAAMNERIDDGVDGFTINGNPDDLEYRNEFIARVKLLLQDNKRLQKMSKQATKAAEGLNFNNLVKEWEDEFFSRLP